MRADRFSMLVLLVGLLFGLGMPSACTPALTGIDHRADALNKSLQRQASTPAALMERGWARLLSGSGWETAGRDLSRAAQGFGEQQRSDRQLARLGEGFARLALAEFDQALEAFWLTIEADPNTLRALVAAQQISETAWQVRAGHKRLLPRLQKLLDSEPAVQAELARVLRSVVRDAAKRSGEWRAAQAIALKMGVIPQWRSGYPFGRHALVAFDQPLGPERAPLDPARLPAPARIRPLWPEDGELDFAAEQPVGVLFAEAFFKLGEARRLRLRLEGSTARAVFVDGQQVARHVAHRSYLPRVSALRFTAGAGWHRLLIKLPVRHAGVRIGVELTDADGTPARVEWWSWPDEPPAPSPGEADLSIKREQAPHLQLARQSAQNPYDAITPLLAGLLAWEAGDIQAARAGLERCTRTAPRFALAHYLAALVLLEDPDLPPGMAELQSRKRLAEAVSINQDFALARFRLALLDAEQGQEESAIAELDRLDKQGPNSFLWPLYAGKIFERLGWEQEADRAYRRAQARMPDNPSVLRARLDLATRHNALQSAEQLAKRLADLGHWQDGLTDLLKARDKHERASTWLERSIASQPSQLEPRLELIEQLISLGQTDRAERQLAQAEAIFPGALELSQRRIDLLDRLGRGQEALRLRKLLVQRHPWLIQLRKALAATEGAEALQPRGAPRLKAETLIAAHEKDEAPPKGNALVLLDQASVEVAADGSSLERIHSLVQVLTPEGIKQWGEIARLPDGSFVEHLRTIGADGMFHEAELVPGKDSITLPALQVGDYVEIAFIQGRRANGPLTRTYLGQTFLFGLRDTPIQRSIYTLATPAGTPLTIDRFNGAPEPKRRRSDGFDITSFETNASAPLPSEPHGPPVREVAPYAQVGFGLRFEDVRDAWRADLMEASRVTPAIRRYALKSAGTQGPIKKRLQRLFEHLGKDVRFEGEADDFSEPAAYVLARREGNRALLLFALLRALDLEPRYFLARTVSHAQLDSRLPRDGSFSHGLIALNDKGANPQAILWMDPAERFNRFGVLYPYVADMTALELTSVGPDQIFTRLPAASIDEQGKRIELELELFTDGTLAGRGVERLTTSQAARYREALLSLSDDQRKQVLEAGLGGYFAGAMLTSYRVVALEDPGQALSIEYRFRAPAWARRRGDSLVLQGGFYPYQLSASLITSADRNTPLLLSDLTNTSTRVQISLPAGARAELSEGVTLEAPLSTFRINASQTGRKLLIDKTLTVLPGRVKPSDYPAFRKFCHQVDAHDTQGIVIELAKPGS
jgi:tetratricopeptide (TPR) repeat protein